MTYPVALQPVLLRLSQGAALSEDEAEQLFEAIIAGTAFPAQIGAALMALATLASRSFGSRD